MSTSVEDRQAYGLLQDPSPSRSPLLPLAERVPRMVALQLAAVLASSIALAYLMIRFSTILESLGSWGYVGVAVAEFSNSAMIIMPTPALAYTFAMGAVLNPFILGLIGGTFATLGEFVGYGLGRRGAGAATRQADGPASDRMDGPMGRCRPVLVSRAAGTV